MKTKLSIGGSLREILAIYRDQAGVLLLLAFALSVVTWGATQLGRNVIAGIAGAVLGAVAAVFFQGVVASLVSDLRKGKRPHSTVGLVRSVVPVALPLVGAGIVAYVGITIGFILLVVPGVILLTIWTVIAPAIVLERVGVFASFGRSQELIRGSGLRVFAVILPVLVIAGVAPFAGAAVVGSLSEPTPVSFLIGLAALTISTPLTGLAPVVLYFRLRAAEEKAAPAIA